MQNNLDGQIVFSAQNPTDLLKYIKENSVHVVILDIDLNNEMYGLKLAEAIRKDATDLKIDSNKIGNYDSIESKIADVFIVLNSICTALDINLFDAIYNKERINEDRKWS